MSKEDKVIDTNTASDVSETPSSRGGMETSAGSEAPAGAEVPDTGGSVSDDGGGVNPENDSGPGKSKKSRLRNKKGIPGELADGRKPRKTLLSRFDLANRFKHWFMGGVSVTRSLFRVKAAQQGVMIISAILAVLFILSAFYTGAGEFVISLDSSMSKDGFYLSNTTDFSEKLVCIRGTAVVADNVNIFDISPDVPNVDGEHNGTNYVAHTFYLTNHTGKTCDYEYTLRIRQSARSAEKALWVMVYHNGKQTIYAMNNASGKPEEQYSLFEFPFIQDAATPDQYGTVSGEQAGISTDVVSYADRINSANALTAVPFVTDDIVCTGVRDNIKHMEIDKYTVVMWYEGEDPDCTDEIIGGWVELYMGFNYAPKK